jgi:hypothetical protein
MTAISVAMVKLKHLGDLVPSAPLASAKLAEEHFLRLFAVAPESSGSVGFAQQLVVASASAAGRAEALRTAVAGFLLRDSFAAKFAVKLSRRRLAVFRRLVAFPRAKAAVCVGCDALKKDAAVVASDRDLWKVDTFWQWRLLCH